MGNSTEHSGSRGHDPASRLGMIAVKARMNPKEQFNNLLHHLSYELVEECLQKMALNSAVGIDEMTVKQARENLSWLLPPILKQIHQGCYEAPAVRRVYIPKADGKERPLGIPTVIDRAIQAATTKVLNGIYEQDFLKCSLNIVEPTRLVSRHKTGWFDDVRLLLRATAISQLVIILGSRI